LKGQSLGEAFLTPTQIYVPSVLAARTAGLEIHGMAHITGGGLPENLPRCLSADQSVDIDPLSWPPLPVFEWLAQAGSIDANAMLNTFNMGIGFALVVPQKAAEQAIAHFQSQQINAYLIGQIISGNQTLVGMP
jgi:phosphoribosylformylglycinamidine cyclo-ligase